MDGKIMVIIALMCAWACAMGPCSPDYCTVLRCGISKAESAAREQGYRANGTYSGYRGVSVDYMDDEPRDNAVMPMTESNMICPRCKQGNCKCFHWEYVLPTP